MTLVALCRFYFSRTGETRNAAGRLRMSVRQDFPENLTHASLRSGQGSGRRPLRAERVPNSPPM